MTPFSEILEIIASYIPDDYKMLLTTDESYAYTGCYKMCVTLGIEDAHLYTEEVKETDPETGKESYKRTGYCSLDLTMSQKWIAALYSYEAYLERLHEELTRGAINFKSLTFELKSLEKQPEQINNKIYMLKRYIKDELTNALGGKSVVGIARKFGG